MFPGLDIYYYADPLKTITINTNNHSSSQHVLLAYRRETIRKIPTLLQLVRRPRATDTTTEQVHLFWVGPSLSSETPPHLILPQLLRLFGLLYRIHRLSPDVANRYLNFTKWSRAYVHRCVPQRNGSTDTKTTTGITHAFSSENATYKHYVRTRTATATINMGTLWEYIPGTKYTCVIYTRYTIFTYLTTRSEFLKKSSLQALCDTSMYTIRYDSDNNRINHMNITIPILGIYVETFSIIIRAKNERISDDGGGKTRSTSFYRRFEISVWFGTYGLYKPYGTLR